MTNKIRRKGAPPLRSPERFRVDIKRKEVHREVRLRSGRIARSSLPLPRTPRKGDLDAGRLWDQAWLRLRALPETRTNARSVRFVDLFSGCGAMSLGVAEACRAIGKIAKPLLAIDSDLATLGVYNQNFPDAVILPDSVDTYLDRAFGRPLSEAEKELKNALGRVDVLVGGPPCQGHSDLNNHTRRADVRNELFLKMARFAEVVRPKHIIVENVRGILHDEANSYERTYKKLKRLGYHVSSAIVAAETLGVPQKRRRLLLVASLSWKGSLEETIARYATHERNFRWACDDLVRRQTSKLFDSSPSPSRKNRTRISYLFTHGLYNLPNSKRPQCHRKKSHSYNSVYGRMYADKPAPTITTGFGSMGQGRYVHPSRERTITPHEAARLQFIPDFFQLKGIGRAGLAAIIGNAVPPKMTYIIALEILR